MSQSALLLASTNLVLLYFCMKIFVQSPFDAVALYFLTVGLFLVSRPLVISLGLHQLWPSELFPDTALSNTALIDTQFLVTLWLFGSALGILVTRNADVASIRFGKVGGLSDQQIHTAAIILLGLSALVTVPLWAQFGGPSGLTRAFKIDKTVSAPNLRLVPLAGTIISSASVLSRFRLNAEVTRRRFRDLTRLAIFAGCAYMSYSWGARDAPVFGLLVILLGRLSFSQTKLSRKAQIFFVLIVGLIAIVGLRVARDIAISDSVNTTITEENLVGQISVASNLTSFDALTLVVRDGPPGGEFHNGSDFLSAFQAALPGLPAPEETRNVAQQVANEYFPDRANGWPVTPLGDWYINFGPLGVLAGGIASGMFANFVRKKTRHFNDQPVTYAVTFFLMATAFQGGLWARSFGVAWQLIFVLALVIQGMRLLRFDRGRSRAPATTALDQYRASQLSDSR